VSFLLFAVAAAALPIHAAQNLKYQSQTANAAPTRVAVRLPDFVPIVNYDQFLLASRNDDFSGMDGISSQTRSAAEELSAKFAGPSATSGTALFHAVVQQDPMAPSLLEAPADPKLGMQVAAISGSDDADDPAKAAKPEPPSEARKITSPRSVVRVHARAPRHAAVSHYRAARRSIVRRARNRVASADTSERSGSAYNGIGADLQRLIGFGTLTQDNRLTN